MARKAKEKAEAPIPNPITDKTRDDDGLNERQRRFAYFYVHDARMNAVTAARMAGYEGSDQSIQSQASHLMNHEKIRLKITEHLGLLSMTAPEVLAEITKIAKMPVEEFTDPRIMTNKMKALEMLGKHHALFTEKVDVTSNGAALTFADLVKKASQ